MISIKIGEKEHQCLLTIRAAKTYEDLTGKDVGSMQTVSEMGYFIFACVDAAARFNKENVLLPLMMYLIISPLKKWVLLSRN